MGPVPQDFRALENVTVSIVNCRTLELTQGCLESVLRFYSDVRILLIDNGSRDASTSYIRKVAEGALNAVACLNGKNTGHGAALHQATGLVKTRYLLTLDSDSRILKGGVMEKMLEFFEDPLVYAVGRTGQVNEWGKGEGSGVSCVHPASMMIDVQKYHTLEPFNHHGAPCWVNMWDASQKGYRVVRLPDSVEFISHRGHGTTSILGGIPGWDANIEGSCRNAKPAWMMLEGANPEIVGSWR